MISSIFISFALSSPQITFDVPSPLERLVRHGEALVARVLEIARTPRVAPISNSRALLIGAGTAFCDSTQSAFSPYPAAIACPCGSTSTQYASGCINGNGTFATLVNLGSASVSAADAELETTGITPNKLAFMYCGTAWTPPGSNPMGLGFGNGIRCIGQTYRLGNQNSGANGTINYKIFQITLPSGVAFTAGSTWLFQTFYRDNPVANCNSGDNYENMSNGWAIDFVP